MIGMRWLVLLAVAGCGASAPAAPSRVLLPSVAPVSTTNAAVAPTPVKPPTHLEPRRSMPRQGFGLGDRTHLAEAERMDRIVTDGRPMPMRAEDVADVDFLSPCVRDFIRTQPEGARRPLIAACSHYSTSCSDGAVVLERPLGERRVGSDASLVGRLSADRTEISLRVSICYGESASPDHITVEADGVTWTSSRLEFQRDGNGCDVAELPLTRPLGRILAQAVEATEASIRFEGQAASHEREVSDSMKRELRVVLDALGALTAR